MEQDQGASARADRAATPSEPSQSSVVSGVAGIPCAFTEGPWCYSLSLEALPNNGDNFHLGPLGDEYGGLAFTILEGGLVLASDAANQANANLIAAAPELFEACRLFVAAGNMSALNAGTDAALANAFDAAEAALAKARGQ